VKKVVLFTLILEFSLVVIVLFALEKFSSLNTAFRDLGPFSGEFPTSLPKWVEDENWKGYTFKEGLRLFYHCHENPIQNLEDIKFYNFRGNRLILDYVPLGDSAFIAFKPLRKGYSVAAVIALDTLLLWIDITSRDGTIDTKFEYFISLLESLKYGDKRIARPEFPHNISNFRKKISPLQLQSKRAFFAFILGAILIANLLTFFALLGGGRCPKVPEFDWEIVTPNVMVYEKLPFGQRSYSACLVKRGNEILVIAFGKVRKILNIDEIRDSLRFLGKTLIAGNSLRFELPDEDALTKWQAIL
jgi:hypothetical protein